MKFRLANKGFFALVAFVMLRFSAPANAYQFGNHWYQAQAVSDGRITVEAANIWVLQCDNPSANQNENGRQFYLYEYVDANGHTRTDRPPYRVISPPNWSNAIGGHDFSDWRQAAAYACQVGGTNRASDITGTWQLTSNCSYYGDITTNGPWKSTLNLVQAADGSLTGTATNDKLNPEIKSIGYFGATIKSQYNSPTMTLVLHPAGWVSVLELTGTLNGSQINGAVHHYTTDDCSFSMLQAR